MQLGLSSAAAPDATFDELVGACARRGMSALELRRSDAAFAWVHAAQPPASASPSHVAAERARHAGVAVAGVLIESLSEACDAHPRELAALSSDVGAPIIIAGPAAAAERAACAAAIVRSGGDACVLVSGDAAALDGVPDDAPVAWQVDDTCTNVAVMLERLQSRPGALRLVRLAGGGPESTLQEGRGIGAIMGRLALAGWSGHVILAPSSTRYRVIWSAWLGRRGGWGCGSAVAPDPIHAGAIR